MPTYDEAKKTVEQLYLAEKYEECERLADHLLGITLKDAWVMGLLGTLHMKLDRIGHSLLFFQRAISLDPKMVEAWNGLGAALRNVGQEDASRECYRKALEIDPMNTGVWSNLAGSYVNYGEPEKCVEYATKALELDPDFDKPKTNMGMAYLEMGDFYRGFDLYRFRKNVQGYTLRDYPCPEWRGEETDCLVLHGEQGIGDEIMFLTCFEELKRYAKNVVVECTPRLVKTMSHTLGVPCYGKPKDVMDNHKPTAWLAMGDLGYWFRRHGKFTDGVYLKSTQTYPKGDKFRIGIGWYGGTRKTHDYARNFPAAFWEPLLKHDVEYISLQYGPHGKSEADVFGITHDQESIDDIDSLIAMVKSCDLVLSVCCTLVHMAGAQGVPCWVFAPKRIAWRYGARGEMPWYKSVRLFRQGDRTWPSVIEEVNQNLRQHLTLGGLLEDKLGDRAS